MTLLSIANSQRFHKLMVVAFVLLFCLATTVMPCFAAGTGGAGDSATGIQPVEMEMAGLNQAMGYVLTILTTAAKWVGAVISAWGVFQIIMAMRREDSEAISKQIMTVVVGAVLIAFGLAAPQLISTLIGS